MATGAVALKIKHPTAPVFEVDLRPPTSDLRSPSSANPASAHYSNTPPLHASTFRSRIGAAYRGQRY